MRRFVLPCVCVSLVAYTLSAYIFFWWPFKTHTVPCPASPVAYQVAVDITASNSDRSNWAQQAERFVGLLKSCDSVRFRIIDDHTGENGEFTGKDGSYEAIPIPLIDPNGGFGKDGTPERDAALQNVRTTLSELLAKRSGAHVSDILSIFNRLDHLASAPAKNDLVIFSDGLESAAGVGLNSFGIDMNARGADRINLEKTCINKDNLPSLLKAAQHLSSGRSDLGKFYEVDWVVTSETGAAGCNSLSQLKDFWEGVMRAQAGGSMPRFKFETNPF